VASATTRQSGETVGNAFKTILTRFTQIKAGIDTGDPSETLNNVDKVLQKVGISLRDTTDAFKPMGTVIDEVAKKWDTFTQLEQFQIATAIGGTRQANILLATLSNYNEVLKAQGIEADSAGLALQRYAIYQNSVEAATNRQTDAWNKLVSATTNSDIQVVFLNLTTKLFDAISMMGGFTPLILTAVSALLLFQGPAVVGAFSKLGAMVSAAIAGFSEIGLSAEGAGVAIASSLGVVTLVITGVIIVYNLFSNAIQKAEERTKSLNDELATAQSNLSKTASSMSSLANLSNEFETLRNKTRLSSDEQKRFLDIQNQLKSAVPQLSGYYDDQGNFIVDTSAKLTDYISLLQQQLDIEQKIADQKKIAVFEDQATNYNKQKQQLQDLVNSVNNPNLTDKLANLMNSISAGGTDKNNLDLKNKLEAQKLAYDQFVNSMKVSWATFSVDQKVAIEKDLQQLGLWDQNISKILSDVENKYTDRYDKMNAPVAETYTAPKTLKDVSAAIDDLLGKFPQLNKEVSDLLYTYNKTGEVTLDMINTLKTAFGDDYIKTLTTENGVLKLNTQAVRDLTMAKAALALNTAQAAWTADKENAVLWEQYQIALKLYDATMNNLLVSDQEVKDKEKAQEDLLKMTIDMIKQEKEAEKQALQDSLSAYKDMIDKKKQALQDEADDKKQKLQDDLDGYKKIIDAEKNLIDQKQKESDYKDQVAEKNKSIADIDAQLLALQFDTSAAGNAKRLQLENDRAAKVKELTKLQNQYSVDNQKTALDKEIQDYEDKIKLQQRAIDDNVKYQKQKLDEDYDNFKTQIDTKITALEDYLKQSGTIANDALDKIQSKSDVFYQSLLTWNEKFGDGLDITIQKLMEALGIKMQLGGSDLTLNPFISPILDDGGVAGGQGTSVSSSTHTLATLLKTEIVTNESQASTFLARTLPNLVTAANKMGGGNMPNIELNVNVAGALDRTILPDLKDAVLTIVNKALSDKGIRRNTFSYSL
jgi:hypothetical protein